jgi:hypothetical protein
VIAISHGTLTHDWFYYVSVATGIGATWVGVWFKYVRPERQRHEKEKAVQAQRRRDTDTFMFGGTTLDGEEIISAPRRLRAVELTVAAVVSSNQKVVEGQGKLEQRMDEANGTAKKTLEMVEKIAGQPPASVAEVKAVMAGEHEAIEARQSELLDAINKDKT